MKNLSDDLIQCTVRILCGDLSKTGSGFFISPEGHIVTNCHVVTDVKIVNGAIQYDYSSNIMIQLGNQEVVKATIESDTNSDRPIICDYAILRINHAPSYWLDTKSFDEICVGEEVISIGFPHDFTMPVVTNGIVSQKAKYPSHVNSLHSLNTIITNTRISHGNSGGPLITVADKRVVGICTLNHELQDAIFQRLYQYLKMPGVQLDRVQFDLLESVVKYTNIGLFHAISIDHVRTDRAWSF